VVGGLAGTSLSTTTKGLFQSSARTSAREICRIRVNYYFKLGLFGRHAGLVHIASVALLVLFAFSCVVERYQLRKGSGSK